MFIIPVIFLLYYLLSYLMNPFSDHWENMANSKWHELLIEGAIVMTLCWIITELSLITSSWMDRLLPWEEWPIRRFVAQLCCQVLLVFALLGVMFSLLLLVFGPEVDRPPTSLMEKLDKWQFVYACLMLSILISAVHTGNYFLGRWKTSMLETARLKLKAAELKQVAMQAQLQSLKLQLDPHFLFNNFSTLSALIPDDSDTAQRFLDNLSRVYRYMIVNLNNDIITIKEELRFIEAYIFLMRIRHGNNVDIDIKIPETVQERGIPPITLQLLIENAIKHNVASGTQPLHIRIYVQHNTELVVTNNIQLIRNNIPSTRLGLENIRNRYALLSEQTVRVSDDDGRFEVTLPLLDF